MLERKAKAIVQNLTILCLLVACGPVAKNVTPSGSSEVIPPYSGQEYRIHSGDTLDVKFFYNPELNELVTVRPDGHISLQLVHDTNVAGLTPAELTQILRQKYKKDLAQPELSVMVRSFAGRKVFVDGEVNTPGAFDIVAPMTLRQSIAQAGGVKETARGKEIIVIRQNAVKGPVVMTANLEKINDGTGLAQDIIIAPSDIVYVPRSPIANVDLWVKQYIKDMLPPIAIPAF